jgi:hypothetical protein
LPPAVVRRLLTPLLALCLAPTPQHASCAVVAVSSDSKPTILVAEKLGAGGVDMLKQVGHWHNRQLAAAAAHQQQQQQRPPLVPS